MNLARVPLFEPHATPTAPVTSPDRTPLRAVEVSPSREQRRARPRTLYAAITVAGVFGILIAQLLMSIALGEGAYQISALQGEQKQLDRQAETMTERLDLLSSPQLLATSAESLGMRSASTPAFLRLDDGAVLGAPTSAGVAAGAVAGPDGELLVANSLLEQGVLAGQGTELPPQQETAPAPSPGTWVVVGDAAGAAANPDSGQNGAAPLIDSAAAGASNAGAAGGSLSSGTSGLPAPNTR